MCWGRDFRVIHTVLAIPYSHIVIKELPGITCIVSKKDFMKWQSDSWRFHGDEGIARICFQSESDSCHFHHKNLIIFTFFKKCKWFLAIPWTHIVIKKLPGSAFTSGNTVTKIQFWYHLMIAVPGNSMIAYSDQGIARNHLHL